MYNRYVQPRIQDTCVLDYTWDIALLEMGKPASPARKEGVGGIFIDDGSADCRFCSWVRCMWGFCAVVRRVLFRKRRASCAADCAASEPLRCQVTPSLHNAPCRERKRDLRERRKGKLEARLRKRTEDTRAKSELQNYEPSALRSIDNSNSCGLHLR